MSKTHRGVHTAARTAAPQGGSYSHHEHAMWALSGGCTCVIVRTPEACSPHTAIPRGAAAALTHRQAAADGNAQPADLDAGAASGLCAGRHSLEDLTVGGEAVAGSKSEHGECRHAAGLPGSAAVVVHDHDDL